MSEKEAQAAVEQVAVPEIAAAQLVSLLRQSKQMQQVFETYFQAVHDMLGLTAGEWKMSADATTFTKVAAKE